MEDPDKKILEWCGHLAVPRLVDEKAYSNCRGCNTKMGGFLAKTKHHHCRLCGHMFCSACTAKYHLPLIFRIKNKDGPARVCMACVDGCLAEKAKAEAPTPAPSTTFALHSQATLATDNISASLQSMVKQVELAPPSSWEEESSFQSCPKCGKSKCKTHNCRVCGLLFCDQCTSKMDIPAFFERKKGKTGPSRVCDSCRFKIVSGAKLVEKLSTPPGGANLSAKKMPPPPPSGFLGQQRRPSVMTTKCSEPGCLQQPTAPGPDGKCVPHGGQPKEEVQQSFQAVVKREGRDDIVAKLMIPSGETSLAQIDILLKKTAPQTEAYGYVFRSEPVPEAFYPIFLAKQLGTTLFIRPKRKGLFGEPSIDELSQQLSNTVQIANNPFKADPEAHARRQAAKKAEEEKKKSKPRTFIKPTVGVKFMRIEEPKKRTTPPPPPPTSSSSSSNAAIATSAAAALASGVSLEEICRARAKNIFGQS